jgi:hypothetical protein
VRTKRQALFSDDPSTRQSAIGEGLRGLAQVGAAGSRGKWWAFEGFTSVDCCLETPQLLLFIEGKRKEALSKSTRWFPDRNQLWRNVEAAEQMAEGRQYGVILAVESEAAGREALAAAQQTLPLSLPHRVDDEAQLCRHFLGFVTWKQIRAEFDLPSSCFVDEYHADRN